jgi:XTP/dITP diphosphohydrolase
VFNMRLQSNFVVIATRNQGKMKEFSELFGEKGIRVRSLDEYSDLPPIVEDGTTFAENAKIKAQIISAHLHVPVFADDSGLCVEALSGDPGVYSARYAGLQATDEQNNEKLLRELDKHPFHIGEDAELLSDADASGIKLLSPASFVCALALIDTAVHETIETEAMCNGYIINEPRGEGGFGYDPLFYLPKLGKTMAELTTEEKNRISHRALAIRQFFDLLSTE